MAPKTTATAEKTAAPKTAPTDNLPAAKQKPLIVQFREYVQQRMATLEDALPPTIAPQRFVSVLMTALQTKPSLLACTFPSLWNACIRAAQDGLLPDGREGAIAPYGENADGKRVAANATWMPMIAGFRKKVFETGEVNAWEVHVVKEKDEFDYALGDEPFIHHKPYSGFEDPGRVVGAYSIAKLKNGETVREVMSAFELMQVMNKSSAKAGPWSDQAFFPEMCRKTVARRHYKQLPHSESMDAMIARDDEAHGLADPQATPIARPERRQLSSRNVMDTYAAADAGGQIIEHDEQTGEVSGDGLAAEGHGQNRDKTREEVENFQNAGQTQAGKTEAKPVETKPATETKEIAGSNVASSETGKGGDAAGEASSQSSSSTEGQGDMPEDDSATVDGADRPWPPGEVPTDLPEYERYFKSALEAITDASKVAPWFNSPEQKELREKCKATVKFKELQDLAIARRKALTPKNEQR